MKYFYSLHCNSYFNINVIQYDKGKGVLGNDVLHSTPCKYSYVNMKILVHNISTSLLLLLRLY